MTEDEWLKSRDPAALIELVRKKWARRKKADRKPRLFAVACCRQVWNLAADKSSRQAIETSERFADGQATLAELIGIERKASPIADVFHHCQCCGLPISSCFERFHEPWQSLSGLAWSDAQTATYIPGVTASTIKLANAASRTQAKLIRDIFGNPFRPVAADRSWLTPSVVSIATAIYQDRAFDRLPILADALEEAGCTNKDVLLHCRQPGEHVRGCWVVDLVLGKE